MLTADKVVIAIIVIIMLIGYLSFTGVVILIGLGIIFGVNAFMKAKLLQYPQKPTLDIIVVLAFLKFIGGK